MKHNFEIDAVILWVDGEDSHHQEKLSKYLPSNLSVNTKSLKKRLFQVNEIEYTVNSILKYAPFIRKIFIVTDDQVPEFLKNKDDSNKYGNVIIVDHTIVFKGYEEYLPIFNSSGIETMVYKIPELSEHYIYFNDDMILIRDTEPSDFFTEKGLPIIRGKISKFEDDKLLKKIPTILKLKKRKIEGYLGYKRTQDYTARLLGDRRKICIDHTPFSFRKSTMTNFFKENKSLLITNINKKFRHENLLMLQTISAHLEYRLDKNVLKSDYQLIRFDSPKKSLIWIKFRLLMCRLNPKIIFMNLNSLNLYSRKKLNYILNWLSKNNS